MIRPRLAAAAAAALMLLSACGTTETPAASPASGGAGGGPVTVTDGRGKEVRLPAPASKVVALEWGEAEMLVSLGVMPAGVADVKGYGTWVTAEKLDPGVKDVGTRTEPSVDSILAVSPDLVVMEEQRDSPLVAQLEKYVPVLVTKGSDARDNLGRMRTDFTMIATAVGRQDRAREILTGFDTALAEAGRKIAGAGGGSFVMADGWQQGSTISIRPFGEGALVSQVAIKLGLSNAWTGKVDEAWGLGQTDVEGLTAITDPRTRFLYNASDNDDVFAGGLKDNAIWRSLPFVQSGRLHRLTNGIWTFGGPKSCEQYAAELVKIFTS
jgi:ferric hydroxamate transport system substrate-binding protein